MVDINFDRSRPRGLLDLSSLPELNDWSLVDDGRILRLGAAVPYTRIIEELHDHCPALAMAARTVGSPQIRKSSPYLPTRQILALLLKQS